MEAKQVEELVMFNASKFPETSLSQIKEKISGSDYNKTSALFANLKDPTTALILSIFLGGLGVDKFYLGNVGMGIFKLITCGGAGIWYLIDLFKVQGATRQYNLKKVMTESDTVF